MQKLKNEEKAKNAKNVKMQRIQNKQRLRKFTGRKKSTEC